MGRWLVEHVFGADPTLHITLADTDIRVQDVAADLRVEATVESRVVNYPAPGVVEGLDDLRGFDGVLISVPIPVVEEVAKAVLPQLKDGTLVFDVCSTKVAPLTHINSAADGRLSIIGTHPLFGPALNSLAGQIVVVCRTSTTVPEHAHWLEAILRHHGATVTITNNPEEHDKYMAYVQMLTHFVFIALARTLRENEFYLTRSWEFQTPPFRFLTSFMGRIMGVDTEAKSRLYAAIQHASIDPGLRRSFVQNAAELDQRFANGDISSTMAEIADIASYFSETELRYSQVVTNSAITAEQSTDIELDRCRRDQRLCGLQIGRNVRAGLITSATPTTIEFIDCTIPLRGEGPFGLQHDDEARGAARELGFSPSPPPSKRLHRRAVKMLTYSELERWLLDNLRHHRRALTLELGSQVNPHRIGEHLYSIVEGLIRCELRDQYRPQEGAKLRATYVLTIRGDRSPSRVTRRLVDAARDLGFDVPNQPLPS